MMSLSDSLAKLNRERFQAFDPASEEGVQAAFAFNGDVYTGTLALDPTCRPHAVDIFIEDGPKHHQDKMAPGIYEFDGNHLILCPGSPGTEDRPRAFPPEGDDSRLCLVFRRC